MDEDVNLQEVVDRCPAHVTGADLYALCSDAMTAAIKRKIRLIEEGRRGGERVRESLTAVTAACVCSGLDSEETPVLLSAHDFSAALGSLKASVSDQELQRYRTIQQKLAAK